MTFKKGVLILVLITASDFMFTGCSHKTKEEKTVKEEKIINEIKQEQLLNQILISEYDPIMRKFADEESLDWRFIAAISYHESRFNNNVVSPVGAVGIMQIMPSVARSMGMSIEEVKVPENNVAAAVKLIKNIEKLMKFPSKVSNEDRLKTILACYNGGVGHVFDARRLAKKHGEDHTKWEPLKKYLQYKSLPEYANDEVVKCGSFKSSETIKFVSVVMKQYEHYCQKYPA